MPSSTAIVHITLDNKGRACVTGTSFRVEQLAIEHTAYGWTAEEIYFQHYRELTPAQIHAALAFYYDHQAEFDDQIRRDDQEFERLRNTAPASPFATRIRHGPLRIKNQ